MYASKYVSNLILNFNFPKIIIFLYFNAHQKLINKSNSTILKTSKF